MQLYLDSYGCYLSVKHERFWLKTPNNPGRSIPLLKLKCILLTKGVSLSSDAVFLALKHNIPIVFIDNLGRSEGYIWSGQFGSISSIRKKQARFADELVGMYWIKEVLAQRVNHQINHLNSLLERHTYLQKEYTSCLAQLNHQNKVWQQKKWNKIRNQEQLAASFRGIEGSATRSYFQALSLVLPNNWQFEKRSRRPALDAFNALLNYLYGMLYPILELSLIKAGLDPYMGVLHIDRHKRPTLVFDTIELYRHWAEKVAVELVVDGKVSMQSHFGTPDPTTGVRLLHTGKSVVIGAMLAFLDEATPYMGKDRKRMVQIDLEMQRLAQNIRNFDL